MAEASATITGRCIGFRQGRHRLIETNPPTGPPLNSIEYLVDGGALSQPFQFSDEILLQRLP